jgi:hypothetical protein
MLMDGTCSTHATDEKCLKNFWSESLEGKRLFGKSRHRWKDNNQMDFSEIRWVGVNWMHLAQYRDQWQYLYEHGNEPSGSIKGREFIDRLWDYQLVMLHGASSICSLGSFALIWPSSARCSG